MWKWLQKKNISFYKAGSAYYILHIFLPIIMPLIITIIAIAYFWITNGKIPSSDSLYNIIINVASQAIYFSFLSLIMVLKYMLESDFYDRKVLFVKPDFILSEFGSIVFILFYFMQTTTSMNLANKGYVLTISILALIMLYLALVIYSEYCPDSKSREDISSELSNNRESRDKLDESWGEDA